MDGAANGSDDENRAIALRRVRDIHTLRDGIVAALRLPDQIKFRLVVAILRLSGVGYPDIMAGSVSDADIATSVIEQDLALLAYNIRKPKGAGAGAGAAGGAGGAAAAPDNDYEVVKKTIMFCQERGREEGGTNDLFIHSGHPHGDFLLEELATPVASMLFRSKMSETEAYQIVDATHLFRRLCDTHNADALAEGRAAQARIKDLEEEALAAAEERRYQKVRKIIFANKSRKTVDQKHEFSYERFYQLDDRQVLFLHLNQRAFYPVEIAEKFVKSRKPVEKGSDATKLMILGDGFQDEQKPELGEPAEFFNWITVDGLEVHKAEPRDVFEMPVMLDQDDYQHEILKAERIPTRGFADTGRTYDALIANDPTARRIFKRSNPRFRNTLKRIGGFTNRLSLIDRGLDCIAWTKQELGKEQFDMQKVLESLEKAGDYVHQTYVEMDAEREKAVMTAQLLKEDMLSRAYILAPDDVLKAPMNRADARGEVAELVSAASASAMAKRASSQRALSSPVSRVESARAKAIAKARDDKPTSPALFASY